MILKRSRTFFLTLQRRRAFSENKNYINNSYLNYVQGSQQNEDGKKKKKQDNAHFGETISQRNNHHMGENFQNVKNIRSYNALKNNDSYSASSRTNAGANSGGGRETDRFSDMNHNQEESNYTSACIDRDTAQEGKDEPIQKGKKGERTDHSYDTAKKGKEYPSTSAHENSEQKNEPLNAHGVDTNSVKEEYMNNDADDLEHTVDEPNEATEFSHMGENDQTKRSSDGENAESGRNPEFAHEEQFSNNPNDGTTKWAQNDEDIPNIFEVDENLTEEEKKEKLKLIKLITEKLAGPLKTNSQDNPNSSSEGAQNNGEDSIFADNRPIAIEVDGPSHFYANSNRYTTYTKLKHRILTKLGYNVIHISYIDWRKLRNKSEREEFILKKLKEKNDEFLDENDRIYYNERMNMIKEDYKKFMKEKKESSS
ncbi:RAP protein, putative [Plasmodium knowlesi strain H]|uniref:RAP protein, putative n=3 Tax=Plasmodium knowlesi TaxID=5850 RepID=A0A5K1UG13_PLAKH|nr:RAP protein, putative [Plasmodium knowlesi strain H]OTN65416.1 putative RAP protein [Plasmodium knowlesi]CAA9989430.1 RAP protein, putative [Plasmodium knowlesi strain H]SBO25050.1 RAP protein, putative [Plasmodium knowlesi strain H]SBO27843.1 RAP protein, putative [Plasmodium knowlesi strain H]VVS78904.1 RAP protein, putative [Plasmodium knowlesi strain H]|eukprot:XP_002260157.1 RAP protein, putative [Plasmodium knowlesi strain H]